MRQFQFEYETDEKFFKQLEQIKKWRNTAVAAGTIFTIYTESLDMSRVQAVITRIKYVLPDAAYMGCSTNGNIYNGELSKKKIVIICTIFEYSTTNYELLQYNLDAQSVEHVTTELTNEINSNPWVKAVVIHTTIRGMSMSDFCDKMQNVRSDVQMFGGGALSEDLNDDNAFVFSSKGAISDHSIVIALIGGEDFNVYTTYITGWKPLGRMLNVTKADGSTLYELDGKPAYETYFKYLGIKNDENFFRNSLEFPFIYEHNGIDILRAPSASLPDGALAMTSDIEEGARARMAYGDPQTILSSVRVEFDKIAIFRPEAIAMFSCAARKFFWAMDADNETYPFNSIAPTSGFYTAGEFLRTGKYLNQHNVTLVIAAMREGYAPADIYEYDPGMLEFNGQVSMIKRLANFIKAATEELEEANRKLEVSAKSDWLTGLYNRSEIQNRITDAIENTNQYYDKNGVFKPVSVIMMDIDDFKKVNDTYGHAEGDQVLKELAKLLKIITLENADTICAGRWGGEEFMMLLPDKSAEEASEIAEQIRVRFAEIGYSEAANQTISLGVTQSKPNENPDETCRRSDDALYTAKRNGKNRVVVL